MSKKKQKSPPPKFSTSGTWHGRYLVMFIDQLDSPAYTSLSAHAKETYTIIRQEYKGEYTGDKVKCPYSTFEAKGVRRGTLSRSLAELECFGFIEIERGGLAHQPSIYRLIDKWKELDNPEKLEEAKSRFKDYVDRTKASKELKKAYRE